MRFWMWTNFTVTVGLFSITLVFLVRRAVRERRLTTELALYLATLTLGWMEAVIDWGAFVYYSTMWPHYPTNTLVLRLIPIVPLHIPLCYTWFFFGGAWMAMRLARVLRNRWPALSMGAALLLCGFVVGFVLDFAVENFFISVGGLWTYTQVWGPLSLRGGTDTQWPVYMAFAMGLSIAPMAYFLGNRNDRGEDLIQTLVRRLRPWRSTLGEPPRSVPTGGGGVALAERTTTATRTERANWVAVLATWIVLVHVIYGSVSLGYAALRWTGVQKTVSTVQPYPDGKPWYDGDITRRDDPSLNRAPIKKAIEAKIQGSN